MNNSSLKKRLLSVAMAAVMVFSLLPATAWAAMAENLPAASGQTRTEQKRGGSDTYTVTRDVKSVAAAQTGAVKKVVCLDLTTGEDQVSLDANGGYQWVAGENYLYLYKVQIEAEGSNALILPAGTTVKVVGKCSITGGGANECAVWSKGDVTVGLGQDATLTVNGLGWRAEGNLTVAHAYDAYTGGELTVNYNGTSSDNGTSGAAIYMGGNTLRVEQGARVTANGSGIGNVKAKDSCGVKGAVYVDGGAELVADGGSAGSAGTSYGIFGDVTVKNGTVTANGGSGLQSYGVSGNSVSVSDGGVLNANGGTAVQDLNSSIKPISGGIYLGNNAVIENATVNASGGVAPCGDSFASVGLQMTSRSEVTVNSGGVLNANGGQLTNGSSANETNGFSAGINMMDAGEANLFVNGTGRVTAIGNPERLDGGTVISYGVNHADMGELTIELSGVASFKAAGGTAASRAAFTPDTVSIKGSEAYRDFDNVTDGYKFLNSTYVRNDVPAQSLEVTVCDHRAGVTNGKCNNCGAEVAAATVTDAAGVTTGYGTFEEAVDAAARLDGSTVRMLADAAVEANYTIAAGTFTIDFNGRKLTVAENNFFAAQTAEVTLTDSASIKVGQPCVPNAAEGGRIIVESGKFGGGIVQRDGGTLLLNGGYFGMITLMDPNENVMDLLGAGKAYRSVLGADAWQDDSNADTTSVAGQKRLHEVEVVDAPLRIIRQTPASGTLTVYETSPTIPSLKVTAAYDSAMSWVFDAKLYYRASAIDGWSTADAPKVSSDGNGTVTVSSNTTLKTGQYQLQLTFHGYRAESRVFNVTLEPCGHPDIDANGKCGTCQYQFVATLTDAAGEVTGYDTLNGALAEVKALSADAQNASRYTVRLHRDVTEDVRVTGGKFTLDLNGKTATVPSGLAISGTTDIGIQNGKLVSDVTVSSASLTVSTAEGLGRITLQGSANVQFYPDASASAFKVESANALLIMNGGTVGTIDMTGGEVRIHFNAKVTGQVNADGGELSVREAPVFDGDVRIGGGARMTVVPNSTAKFNGVLEFAEEAVGELAGGTYKKLGIAAGRTLSELLKSGYVYYRVDISEFIQGKTDNLTNVKVISHVHSIRGDGTCACGESFTASVSSGASVDWYKTLSEALAAVKTLSAGVQDAALYTVRLYQDAAEDVSINGGKFTLDLNGHKAGNTAFTAGGSAAVILSGGEVSCNMQVRDTADLTVNGTVLRDVELYGSAKLTASGAAMGHLQTRDGTPAAVVTGGTISRITMQAGTVGLTGSVTVENQTEVLSGGVLTVTAQSGEPEFRNAVTIGDGGKLVASAGKFRSNVEFGIGAKGELSGGEYGGLECGGDQLLKDMLKTGYAYFGIEHLENGYVNSLMSQSYTVRPHSNHSYEWDAATHEKKCGCGDVSETDTAAPVIGFLNGAALKTENGRQVMDVTDNVIYTVTDANEVRVTVSYGSGTAAEVRPDAGGRYELPLSEGDGKPVTITAADEAGNVATVTFTLYRLVDMRISSHVGVAVEEADLTRTVRSGQTYTLRVTMLPGYTGEDGLELEQGALTTKQRFTGSDAAGYTVQVTADFNNSLLRIVGAYDNTPPTAEITIRNSSFRNFLNRISFGLFFKETQTVSVTAADVGAGLDKAEYLLSGTAFTKKADAGAADGWTALTLDTDGRGSFTVAPNSKGFLYVKAIDREGNVTVVNADGMVVYTDAEQITERVSFAEASADDCVFRVKDNGSTVRSITMGSRALVRDTEYRIGASTNGQLAITLTNSFLTSLTAGSYTLTVSYDPLGETYVSGGDNQAPASTTVVLTVGRATVDADIASMDKIYDSEPVTPSANTESDGVMTWEFKPDGADPGAYTTAAPEDAGTYNVRLTVAETEHYDRIEKTGTFTITPKEIQLHTPALEDKTYDGSTAIVCMYYYPERAMEGKISGDDLSVVMGQANADSPDVGRRTVTFTGFALAGSDAANYTLAAQPISGSAAITARPLSIGGLTVRDKLYDGLNTAAIEGTPTLVNLADGETLMLRCGTPTFDTVAAGDNIPVSFTEFTIADSANGKAGNYSLTQPAGITASIRAYTATGAEYTASTGQWTNQDFMVTAADGWQVSGTNTANGDWRGSLTRSDETGTGSLTFYVKNTADGYISESVTLTYKIDKTNPTGEIRIDQRNAWQSFWNTISFDLFYKSRQTVTLTAADEASGVTAIEYLLSEEDYTAAQLDGMTLQPYTAPVAITPNDRLIAYARITDAAGNVTYLRSDGVVLDAAAPVIAGVDDGAVYCGSVTFTVTDAYLDTVTVDGTAAVSAPGRAAGSTYIIEADSQLHTIVATDRAGNSTQVQITVNNGHTVGTPATCKAPAVCRYCGESFGDPAPGNHGSLRRVTKVNATSTADGNIEYWYCSGCGKYYLDAAAGREITRGDTILPAIGLRIVDDVRVWRPGDKPLGVTFRQEYDDFTAQIDGVTVDPANYEVTADPDGGRLIVTFRAQFLRTLAFGERTITIVSDDGSASVSFRRDGAHAGASGGKDGGKAGVTSAATGDGFPMGGMAAALLVSGSALVMLTTRARRKEEK